MISTPPITQVDVMAEKMTGERLQSLFSRLTRGAGARAMFMVVPLLVFLTISFLMPIGLLLFRAVDNREVQYALPATTAALTEWDPATKLPDTLFSALNSDLSTTASADIADVARRLNFYSPGLRSKISKAARAVSDVQEKDARARLINTDGDWGRKDIWIKLKQASPAFTGYYFLRALDLDYNTEGQVVASENPLYVSVILRTIGVSLCVTFLCLITGYPLAYLISSASAGASRFLMALILLPFWTSLLVRTTAWLVLLQTNGIVNSLLRFIGAISEPLELVHNRIGVFVAMTHILLPFMILPIHAVMKGVPHVFARAASSLGASPIRVFIHVYLPLTFPGIAAGSLLVFILSLGYYITPALVGGAKDQMLSSFVAYFINESTNWSMASALASMLLFIIVALYICLTILFGRKTGRRSTAP